MHGVLARQMRRLGLTLDETPVDLDAWKLFLERVEGYYEDADQGRYLLERSLRFSSDELIAANQELATLARVEIEQSEARYRDLFNLTRIATWEENFEIAALALGELRGAGVTDIEAHFDAHPDVLVEIVKKIEITAVNPAVASLVRNNDLASMIGPVADELIDERNTSAWVAQLKAVWDGVESIRIDHLVGSRQDGEVFHGVLEWHVPRAGDSFDYRRAVVTIVDITEMVEAEHRMQQVLESKDEFLASISHELRTPLTSVLGFAEVLREMGDETGDSETNSLLEIIASQAADLSDIVEDLLVAARAELGQLTVGQVPVDLYAQVAQTLESGHGYTKEVLVQERPPITVKGVGDPQRVRQVLRNLISNAMKYGGSQISVEINQDDEHVYVAVIDDGGGLDEVTSQKIFERYYRSRPEVSLTGSVGIGLTIARDLARMMDGDLYYDRRADLTVFTLRLPRLIS